ncbi:serine hydrolase domain-containing protein [Robiginitalea biformata]|uniref:Beta-lactamase n=1 Tax=Robiginitalea biformata (strain ATCC BAA-864 / DSM 15991 / KCTC 12146 / HTCC2501) TaxID=313596 RepID=A4CMC7_ROBBH|nr:serine hydrolase domain-containing protein [Robiginitalea biformata]EAR14819.1 beta-lactamase precursor [Robiginitalea biformata HTCC2501]
MKMVTNAFLVFFFYICAFCWHGLAVAQNLNSQIDSLITEKIPSEGPGAVVLVARGDSILYRKAFGQANLELQVPMKPDQVFQIGSMTKQFTAIAILKLMEEGRLHLEDDVRRFIPDYPTPEGSVTIHHLLNHTSGIKDFTSMRSIMEIARKDLRPQELIDFFKNEPMDFKPGTQFKYNNSGYVLLGYIIEKVSGKSYEEYIESELFTPAGMTDSRYAHYREIVPNRAYGYHNRKGYTNKLHISMNIPYASGALMASSDDLLKWQRALQTEKLVTRRTLELALSPKKLADGSPVEYGYGWHIKTIEGAKSIEHGGSVFGFKSMGVFLPEKDLYVVGLTNCDCISPTQLVREIATVALSNKQETQ